MIWQLIAHGFGDYFLQNDAMANNKTLSWKWTILHVSLYGLPFLLLVDNSAQWLFIVITHAFIDRYRLTKYWCLFWGVGCEGSIPRWIAHRKHMNNYVEHYGRESPDYEERVASWEARELPQQEPPFWLVIVTDQIAHLACNAFALQWMSAATITAALAFAANLLAVC